MNRHLPGKAGGLDQPDSGILFTVPISYVEGLGKYQ